MRYVLCALDQGGLLTNTGEVPSRAVWQAYGLREQDALGIWKQNDEAFFGGRMSESEWWGHFAARAPNQVPVDEVKRIFRERFEAYQGNLDLVRGLRGLPPAGQVMTVIWTNNAQEWLDFQKERFQVGQYVDGIVSSHELGITKHDPRYFDAALAETSVRLGHPFEKGEVVFFDDDAR